MDGTNLTQSHRSKCQKQFQDIPLWRLCWLRRWCWFSVSLYLLIPALLSWDYCVAPSNGWGLFNLPLAKLMKCNWTYVHATFPVSSKVRFTSLELIPPPTYSPKFILQLLTFLPKHLDRGTFFPRPCKQGGSSCAWRCRSWVPHSRYV